VGISLGERIMAESIATIQLLLTPEELETLYKVIGHVSDADFEKKFKLDDDQVEIIHDIINEVFSYEMLWSEEWIL
jgi:hypothetical protein